MNRTGTYVAFDGLGETNPTKSDFRYYATLQAWTAHKNIEFSFVNSHEKTYAVRDTSSKATLYARIPSSKPPHVPPSLPSKPWLRELRPRS